MGDAIEKLKELAREVTAKREKIDWGALDATTIRDGLRECPELQSVLWWTKLSKDTWFELLKNCDVPVSLCPWLKHFSGEEWCALINARPMLADYCDWSKLSSMDWCGLLAVHPAFYKFCSKENLNGTAWSFLLREHPDFVENDVDWGKFDGEDWVGLLKETEEYASHCDWTCLDGTDWAELLIHTQSFDQHCDWSKLSSDDWRKVLRYRPALAEIRLAHAK